MFISILVVALAFQSSIPLPPESPPDLRQIANDDTAARRVEIRYRDEEHEQLMIVHGDGEVVAQSTKPSGSASLTCKGRVAPTDVKQILVLMLNTRFLELPRNSYIVMGDDSDWRKLKIRSITVKEGGASAERYFAAGEYGGKKQKIPEQFAAVEKALLELKRNAIPEGTRCTLAPPGL